MLQAAGRAGRPQFDDEGVVVVMTRPQVAERYEHLLAGSEIIESAPHVRAREHIYNEGGQSAVAMSHSTHGVPTR